MDTKQISLTLPKILLNETKNYSEQLGYTNVQELILDLLRKKVMHDKIEEYDKILHRMKINGKTLDKKGAKKYLAKI